MILKKAVLFISVLLACHTTFAISLSSSFNLFSDGTLIGSDGEDSGISARLLCRRGSTTCTFTEFYSGKRNAYDLLVPWFMDDDYSVQDITNVTVVYQTGDILYNQKVIGKARTIHSAFGEPEIIELYVPFSIHKETRTVVIGQ